MCTVRALLATLGLALVVAASAGAATSGKRVLAIRFGPDLEVNPVTQDYLTSKLSKAAADHYDAAVIVLDTPGGLSTSMKTIYTAELNAKLPVIVYVSPDGARAASAGVWISEAADVLAMAPTTNIGSSTPIDSSGANLGSDLRRKVINDAAASLTALAAAHKRNTTWPGRAVRVASNLTAQQALKMNVIDLIAPSLPSLLDKLQGYKTKDVERPYTLNLAGAHIDNVSPGFFTRFLNTLIDPNLISIFFLAGIIGLIFEVFHPGVVLPGALGAVFLVIALYGFSVLNPSWGGIALVVLGVALLVIDLHAMTRRADDRRADCARLRPGAAVPERAGAVPCEPLADRRHRARRIGAVVFHAEQGNRSSAAACEGRRRAARRHGGRGARRGARVRQRRALAGRSDRCAAAHAG